MGKKRLGYILFAVVLFCWISVPILPFFEFPHKIMIISTLLISGEILFVITLSLLGKVFWEKIKIGFFQLFKRKTKTHQNHPPDAESNIE